MHLEGGQRFGPYVIAARVGEGGMGIVWIAERADDTARRRIALKLPRQVWGGAFAERLAREREILAHLTEGLSNAEIAARLGVSEKTVRNHLSHLFDKLGVWTRAQAMVFARDHGFTA